MRKQWLAWSCLVATALTASADDPSIGSFGTEGSITFDEVTNAAAYQVEWSSRLDGDWSDFERPDLQFIPPAAGSGSMTTSVPMRYRVVADVYSDYLVVDLSGGPSATNYPVSSMTAPPPGGWTDAYKTTQMVFRLIPPGTYERGSPTGEVGRFLDEDQHPVTISRPFYIGVFEVTQQQWERVMGTWPSYFSNAAFRATRPVEQVTHADIVGPTVGYWWPETSEVDTNSFMGRMRERTGMAFHLPTEGEWEYAGRAGSTAALTSGLNITNLDADESLGAIARYEGNSDADNATRNSNLSQGTTTVGSYPPNNWGLYDIHGNVMERVADTSGPYPDVGTPLTDPRGASFNSGGYTFKLARGGGYFHPASNSRLARRGTTFFSTGFASEGFRAAIRIYPEAEQ